MHHMRNYFFFCRKSLNPIEPHGVNANKAIYKTLYTFQSIIMHGSSSGCSRRRRSSSNVYTFADDWLVWRGPSGLMAVFIGFCLSGHFGRCNTSDLQMKN